MEIKLSSITKWSLVALGAGLGLGLAGHLSGMAVFAEFGAVTKGVGTVWIASLQLVTLPLVIALLLASLGNAQPGSIGALGLKALALYLVALVIVGVVNLLVIPPLIAHYQVDPATVAALNAGVTIPAAAANATTGMQWPGNIFEAAVRGQLFPLLLFAMAFALASTRLPEAQRIPIARAFQGLADTMMVMVQWLVMVTPIGVFALSYGLALRTGGTLAGLIGVYLVIQCALSLVWVLLFYPATAVFGRTSLRAFARAVLPAQIVAVTTRSSAASLPAMVDGARQHGVLSDVGTKFALPLSVSFFRISEVILSPVKLVFLAHVYGVTLQPMAVVGFFITVLVFSVIGTGTPNSGGGIAFRMVPVFAAAGIPIEGVMIVEAVETIPDLFATLANVTSQMGASVILSRKTATRSA